MESNISTMDTLGIVKHILIRGGTPLILGDKLYAANLDQTIPLHYIIYTLCTSDSIMLCWLVCTGLDN